MMLKVDIYVYCAAKVASQIYTMYYLLFTMLYFTTQDDVKQQE